MISGVCKTKYEEKWIAWFCKRTVPDECMEFTNSVSSTELLKNPIHWPRYWLWSSGGSCSKRTRWTRIPFGLSCSYHKSREVHNIKVPCDLVYVMMQEVDLTGLEERGGVGQPKRPPRVQKFKSQVTYFWKMHNTNSY
jgi:hypothetical protein